MFTGEPLHNPPHVLCVASVKLPKALERIVRADGCDVGWWVEGEDGHGLHRPADDRRLVYFPRDHTWVQIPSAPPMPERRGASPCLRDWLTEGPFSLALSAGFFGFFAHAGFVSALEDAGFVPTHVTGASAGALIGGVWASGASAASIERELRALRREHFWDPAPGFGLLRGELFRERVSRMLSARDFATSPVRAALSAFDVRARRTVVLGTGDLARAICASCAFPVLLQPVDIGGRPMLDGGIADRPGHAGLDSRARVLFHHLLSRSPWRANAPGIPQRRGMLTVTVRDLPRLGPFHLGRGGEAFDRAREATTRALDVPAEALQTVRV